MSKIGLVWFKNDLRIQDNEIIARAISENDKVIYFYCLDEFWLGKTKYGFDKIGGFRLKFLFETLEDLRHNLKKTNNQLIISYGKTEIILNDIYQEIHFDNIYFSEEITSEELEIEDKVLNILSKNENSKSVKVNKIWNQTLIHIDDLKFSLSISSPNTLPDIFTQFRINVEKFNTPRTIIVINHQKLTETAFNNENINHFDKWEELKQVLSIRLKEQSPKAALKFIGGESEAQNRLNSYFYKTNSIWTYKLTRNGLLGENYSSKFSPYLALGAISAKQIYTEIKKYEKEYGANESTYWLYFELLWRDYFKFVTVKYGSNIFKYNGLKSKKLHLKKDIKLAKNWLNGTTKEHFVNANMIELNESGWMSNRGRQNVASYLVHDLGIDWRIGAEYFESLLLDYDVSSNWCNWQYVSGVGNDPRENRKFNIKLQQERYDPNNRYTKYWLGNGSDSLF